MRRTCQGGIAGRGGEGHGEGRGYAELEAVVLTELTRHSYTLQVPSKYSGPGLGRDGGVSLIAVGPRATKGGGPKQAGGGRGFEEWGTFNRARVRKVEVPFEGVFDTKRRSWIGMLDNCRKQAAKGPTDRKCRGRVRGSVAGSGMAHDRKWKCVAGKGKGCVAAGQRQREAERMGRIEAGNGVDRSG